MEKYKKSLPLILVLILAAALRFWGLGINPPALNWDEAAWGYNAYSLGQTGRDEFGRFLPLNYLESFGDFKPPVYAYLTILPVKIFGLNEFAVRFPSAFFGVLTVLLTYFLVKEMFPSTSLTLPLIASFLLAISPWHIMLSRAAFEANVATFFIIAGIFCFLRAINQDGRFLPLAALSFALSLQTFNTARVVTPLLVFGLVVAFRQRLWQKRNWLLVSVILGLLLLLPALRFYLTPQAKLRFKEVNIFTEASVVETANQEMTNDNWVWWSRIIHNRRWGYLRLFLRHYFDHFNPYFLFFKGDGNPKFSTQDVGEFYLWELPFLVAGILILIKKKPGYWWLVPFWLLVGIIPAATARETPHALRIETTLPTWQILTALGVVEFWNFLDKQKRFIGYGLLVACWGLVTMSVVYFQHGYWRHYPVEYSGEWQYGYKPVIDYLKSVENKYDQIWFTDNLGRPYIYFLFYLKYSPKSFWQKAQVERDPFGFVHVRGFDKYHFFGAEGPRTVEGALYVDAPTRVPDHASRIKTFNLLNDSEILVVYERVTQQND